MNNPKFTPGEWSISDIKTESYGFSAEITSDSHMAVVAELKATTTPMVDWLPNVKQFKANLTLFKAAPEMYQMLETLLNRYSNSPHIQDPIIKLLAKARGE